MIPIKDFAKGSNYIVPLPNVSISRSMGISKFRIDKKTGERKAIGKPINRNEEDRARWIERNNDFIEIIENTLYSELLNLIQPINWKVPRQYEEKRLPDGTYKTIDFKESDNLYCFEILNFLHEIFVSRNVRSPQKIYRDFSKKGLLKTSPMLFLDIVCGSNNPTYWLDKYEYTTNLDKTRKFMMLALSLQDSDVNDSILKLNKLILKVILSTNAAGKRQFYFECPGFTTSYTQYSKKNESKKKIDTHKPHRGLGTYLSGNPPKLCNRCQRSIAYRKQRPDFEHIS